MVEGAGYRHYRTEISVAMMAVRMGGCSCLQTIASRKLRRNLATLEKKYESATLKAKDAEILHEHAPGFLEPETELERTYKVRQDDIVESVALVTAQKKFDLKLDQQLGPYMCEYSRNGTSLGSTASR